MSDVVLVAIVTLFLWVAITLIVIRGPIAAEFDKLRDQRDYWRERAIEAEDRAPDPNVIEGVRLLDPKDGGLDIFLHGQQRESE